MNMYHTEEGYPVTSGQSEGFIMMPLSTLKQYENALKEWKEKAERLENSNFELAKSVKLSEENAWFYKRLADEERSRQEELIAKVGYVLGRSEIVRDAWYNAGLADGWLRRLGKEKTEERISSIEEVKDTAESIEKSFTDTLASISTLLANE